MNVPSSRGPWRAGVVRAVVCFARLLVWMSCFLVGFIVSKLSELITLDCYNKGLIGGYGI